MTTPDYFLLSKGTDRIKTVHAQPMKFFFFASTVSALLFLFLHAADQVPCCSCSGDDGVVANSYCVTQTDPLHDPISREQY